MNKRENLIVGIIAIIVAIIMIFVGKEKEKRCIEKIQANIIEINQNINYDTEKSTHSYSYYPVIEYKIGDKTIRKDCKDLERNQNSFKRGDKIDILYNPNNIEEFIIPEKYSIVYLAYFILGAGVISIIYGLFKDVGVMY